MQLFGIGITTSGVGNNLTLYVNNKQYVLVVRKYNQMKIYKYSDTCHKPTILKFFGFVSGIIHPNDEYQNMY